MLEPGFRPAVLAVRAFDALARESGEPGGRSDGPRADRRFGLSFRDAAAAVRPPAFGGQRRPSRALRQVHSLVARRLAPAHRRAGRRGGASSGSLSRHACRTVRLELRRRARLRSPAHHRPHAGPAAGTVGDQAARPSPGRQPHRLRSRRQRSQGGRGRRRPRRLQRRDGLGSVPQAGSAVSLRRDHGLAAQGRGASPACRRHRRQRRRRLRQQPGPRWFAVSRCRAGSLRCARQEHVSRPAQGLERRAVRGRERRRGDGARRVDVARRERDSRHRARHQHGGRLRDARGQHHVVARTSSRSFRSTTTRTPRSTSGRATTASARSTSRSRPSDASCPLPASTRPPISACPSD